MSLEDNLHQCRVMWTKARESGDSEMMKEMEKKAKFFKRLLESRERWKIKVEEIKKDVEREQLDQAVAEATKIFTQ